MTDNGYYGNNFKWWVGVVEDRKTDPLKMGCVKVRIFGFHPFQEDGSPDKSTVPTENLPWAQVCLPVNGVKTLAGPREGDWVFGHFLDGANAQNPIILGCYPGVDNKKTIEPDKDSPKPPEGIAGRVEGEPTTPRIGRGVVEGTMVNKVNQERVHVCDVTNMVKDGMGLVKLAFGTIVEALNRFVRSILNIMGAEPGGVSRKLVQFAKDVNSFTDKIRKIADEINEIQEIIVGVARKVREIIDYIMSLPEKALRFIRECTMNLIGSITSQVGGLLNVPGISSEDISSVENLVGALGKAASTTLGLVVDVASTPVQAVDAFLSPQANMSDQEFKDVFNSWVSETQGTVEDINTETSSFNQNNP
jgi:archaellum component FlaC